MFGILYFFAYFSPLAFLLLLITKLIIIGKLLSLDRVIRFLRFDPLPEIKTHVFFFYHLIELDKFILFLSFDICPIS